LARQKGLVSVEGHTDNTPITTAQFPSNWELSAHRASAVARYLQQKGVPADHLRSVGLAETHPRENNATLAGRAGNRRVSLVILGPEASG
jgi:chemotaxis protein MotB